MAAQKADDICDCAPIRTEEIDKLYDFFEIYRSHPLLLGQDWARDRWFQLRSVIDRMTVVQKEAKVKKGKGKAIICAVLGACLAAVVEDRKQRSCQAEAVVASLQAAVTVLQEQLQENKRALEEEKSQNLILKEEWRNQLLRETDTLAEAEVPLEETGLRQVYPWGDLKGVKEAVKKPPHMCPLVKTEYVYEDDNDNCPQVITKEIPCTATKLAKLRKDFARTVRESETEYVWRVSLSGRDGILLSEKEAEGYWGPGVFLTTGDCRVPWLLTQRVAYWAGGLNPLERGDPLAITSSVDQLLESVQKVACLQMMYDWELKPNLSSPMLLPVDPERMTPLIRGLPNSLKPIGIQLRGKIQNIPREERITAALEGMVTPEHRRLGRKDKATDPDMYRQKKPDRHQLRFDQNAFSLPIELSLSQPMSFFTFTLPILFPILPGKVGAEQPQTPQPGLIGEVLQPSDHLHGPPLDSLQQLHVSPVLGTPDLDTVLQVESHKSRVEGQNHLPRPAGHTSFDAAQDTVGFLGCKRTLLAHVELLINQYPQVLLLRAALNPFPAQPLAALGIAPTHVQNLALGLVELHGVHIGPPLNPVRVPLDGIPSLQCVSCTTQLGVVGKLAEGALSPTVHVTDKDVEQCRSQYQLLRNATCHWSPLGYQAVDGNSLSATIQPFPYPLSGLSIKSMSLQFRDKDVMRDSVKCLAQVQVDDVCHSSLIHQCCNLMVESHRICQT
ncbi:hypothetical protein GRJ2_002991600 [Grus japonensis]|uniref:Uncharacterized protein n=1 Tax=Grus japonensis TaxID=30415 RepID=A0ABC9Y7K9_GRUJA